MCNKSQGFYGDQPEPVAPTDEEIRRLWDEISAKAKAKMVQEFMDYGDISAAAATAANVGSAGCYDVEKFARAVLARWGRPTPQPPAELAEMVKRLHEINNPTPQPVAVGERLPGPEDCDAEGRCWFWCKAVKTWDFRSRNRQMVHDTHWLPYHSLPFPTHHD